MAGRKTKLTPEVQAKIVQALGVGTTHAHACQYAGIHHDTFYFWLQKGAEGTPPYSEFSAAVKNAEGQAVVGWMALIDRAARGGNWQAAAWKLERRYPKDYGRRVVDLGEDTLAVLAARLDRLPEHELRAVAFPGGTTAPDTHPNGTADLLPHQEG
jgi:hypothetical protein